MRAHVRREVGGLREALVAVAAAVGALARVRAQVRLQRARARVRLAADAAQVRLLLVVLGAAAQRSHLRQYLHLHFIYVMR